MVAEPGVGSFAVGIGVGGAAPERPENALDALLDELQTFARPQEDGGIPTDNNSSSGSSGGLEHAPNGGGRVSTLRRMHSYDGQQPQGKPPVPERNAELVAQVAGRRVPPPPPPRTSSRSPLASPTSPLPLPRTAIPAQNTQVIANAASNSSSCESVNSQDGAIKNRTHQLDQRHQELLRKQKALQEQYARLQKLQQSNTTTPLTTPLNDSSLLKKTGSEGNLLLKMNLNIAPAFSGSLTQLAQAPTKINENNTAQVNNVSDTNKVYETDIL